MKMNRGMNPIQVCDCVAIKVKTNPDKAGKWTKSGVITDYLGFQNYEIKIDGSNHLSTRHRSHLRKIVPYINSLSPALPKNSLSLLLSHSHNLLRSPHLVLSPRPITSFGHTCACQATTTCHQPSPGWQLRSNWYPS